MSKHDASLRTAGRTLTIISNIVVDNQLSGFDFACETRLAGAEEGQRMLESPADIGFRHRCEFQAAPRSPCRTRAIISRKGW